MVSDEQHLLSARDLSVFDRVMGAESPAEGAAPKRMAAKTGRLELDPESTKNGLGQLVLALVKLLHELLERQALRRIDAGTLTDEQIEKLGLALMKQTDEIDRLRREFDLDEEDLNLDLGPLGKLL